MTLLALLLLGLVRTGEKVKFDPVPGRLCRLSTLSRFRRCFVESRLSAAFTTLWNKCRTTIFILVMSLWTPAQRKRASMLYFANVFFLFIFFYGRLILRPWLTEVRESFTRGGP